ncbi:MAG: serine/threonine-protein kinase [Jatrophihabitantaceae bacterium]
MRDPRKPGGVISDDTAGHGPVIEAVTSQPETGSGWLLGGRYRVIARIGAGAMAEVFRAHDQLLARDVAVKVFRTPPVSADTASGAQRQEIELHALARLNHPNLITLFDGSINGSEGPTFLVMELIEGPCLSARIADAALSEPEAREVGIQIADALAYVHAEGMVHRDVKPANILLGTDPTVGDHKVRARLSDFGIVRLLGSERMTAADFTLGTASYLAPEQARGSNVGPVADVYSLGLVLIEALTGVRSFDLPALEALMARLSRGPEIPADLAPPWPGLLTAMTASDPRARPTAAQVAQILRDSRTTTAPFPLAAGVLPPAAASAGLMGAAGLVTGVNPWEPTDRPNVADAPTVGLAALAASAGTRPPMVGDPWEPTDRPRRATGRRWLIAAVLAAAALAAVALAVVGLLALQPASRSTPPADPRPGAPSHALSTTHSSPLAPANAPATRSSRTATSSPPTTTAAPTGSAAPTSSAVASSSAAPSTSLVTSSTPPSTTTSAPATASSTAAQGVAAGPSTWPSPSPASSTP